MKIDNRLNLVIPHKRENGQEVFVHSMPITRETFKQHFEALDGVVRQKRVEGVGVRCLVAEQPQEARAPCDSIALLRHHSTRRSHACNNVTAESRLEHPEHEDGPMV